MGAYEGLAVTQFMDNDYERLFYGMDQRMKSANWKKDAWVRELENSAGNVRRAINGHPEGVDVSFELQLIRGELTKAQKQISGFQLRQAPRTGPLRK